MQIYRMGVRTGKIYNDDIHEKADEPTILIQGNSLFEVKIKACFEMILRIIKGIWRCIKLEARKFRTLFRFVRAPKKVARGFRRLTPVIDETCKELDEFATIYQNIADEKKGDPFQDTIIAVDFDGTLCEDRWPKIGAMNEELILSLIWRQRHGQRVILWTCREGEKLNEAVKACEEKGLYFDAVNENLDSTVSYYGGNKPRKVFATEYIDDRNSKTYWKLPYHPVTTKIIIK